MDIDALIRMKHLKEDERQDPKALQKALTPPLLGRGEPPVMRNGGELCPTLHVTVPAVAWTRLTLHVTRGAPLASPASASAPPLEGCIEAREP
jgi:hypothetical protein